MEEAEARRERAQQVAADADRDVENCRAKLEKERAMQAHRGFEAAIEASQAVEGFEELQEAMGRIGDLLASAGEGEQEWLHVATFINKFGRQLPYESSEDSDIRDLVSASSATREGTEEEDGAEGGPARTQMEEEAELVQRACAPRGDGRLAAQSMAGLERVQQEALLAVQNIREATVRPQVAEGSAQTAAQQGTAEGQHDTGIRLAIMDAADHAVPSSGESGGEVAEPNRKRRGREVQVAGGNTGEDIPMARNEEERNDGGI